MSDVIVVGGGIIGLSCAWRLQCRGAEVTVIDPTPGRGASRVAAGMLAPATEASFTRPHHVPLDLASARRWPSFARELEDASGHTVGFRATGTLVVGRDADDRRVLDDLVAFQAELGLRVERLGRRDCRRREPELHPAVAGGVVAHDDHHVDPRAVVAALLEVLGQGGPTVLQDTVVDVGHGGGRVTHVTLRDAGRRDASQVVLAAGSGSAAVTGLPTEVRVPVRGVKGQILRLRSRDQDPVLSSTVRGVARGRLVYLVPRGDGRVVVGATQEDVGDDLTVTAGGLRGLLEAAVSLVPAVDELELVEATAGLRPATPDGLPVIGATTVEGLYLATGHHRGGILLAPITADAIASLLAGDRPDPVVSVADPGRPALRAPAPSTAGSPA